MFPLSPYYVKITQWDVYCLTAQHFGNGKIKIGFCSFLINALNLSQKELKTAHIALKCNLLCTHSVWVNLQNPCWIYLLKKILDRGNTDAHHENYPPLAGAQVAVLMSSPACILPVILSSWCSIILLHFLFVIVPDEGWFIHLKRWSIDCYLSGFCYYRYRA